MSGKASGHLVHTRESTTSVIENEIKRIPVWKILHLLVILCRYCLGQDSAMIFNKGVYLAFGHLGIIVHENPYCLLYSKRVGDTRLSSGQLITAATLFPLGRKVVSLSLCSVSLPAKQTTAL